MAFIWKMVVYEYEWFLESLSFLQAFLPNVANKEVGITQLANINQLPRSNGFTSPPKEVTNTSSF